VLHRWLLIDKSHQAYRTLLIGHTLEYGYFLRFPARGVVCCRNSRIDPLPTLGTPIARTYITPLAYMERSYAAEAMRGGRVYGLNGSHMPRPDDRLAAAAMNDHPTPDFHVAIIGRPLLTQTCVPFCSTTIGAGIGGLALAMALNNLGVSFTLYEEAKEYSTVGRVLSISSTLAAILTEV
jgi:hypothetical protein